MPHYINAEYKYMQNCIYKYVTKKLLKQATNIISNSKYLKHFVVEKLGYNASYMIFFKDATL